MGAERGRLPDPWREWCLNEHMYYHNLSKKMARDEAMHKSLSVDTLMKKVHAEWSSLPCCIPSMPAAAGSVRKPSPFLPPLDSKVHTHLKIEVNHSNSMGSSLGSSHRGLVTHRRGLPGVGTLRRSV
mmetsp:Transcript_58164/g.96059  ORF Transcript_58164/g.96059 Transcript_58164/m.96059 type:complete len:127 (+) Transcript_58164:34-414(+)